LRRLAAIAELVGVLAPVEVGASRAILVGAGPPALQE
jgi:hypothetical protein